MSDFLLTEIAPFVEKDARTLRRWCEQGHVPGAYRRRGARGHWRIRGKSVQHVVGRITASKPENARRRVETAYPVRGFFSDPTETPKEAWAKLSRAESVEHVRALQNSIRRRRGLFMDGCYYDFRSEKDRERLLKAEISAYRAADYAHRHEYLASMERAALERLMASGSAKRAKRKLAVSDRFGKQSLGASLTVAGMAVQMGISRRTFYRWFPQWRRAAFDKFVQEQPHAAIGSGEGITDYDPQKHAESIDAVLGWNEPDEMAG